MLEQALDLAPGDLLIRAGYALARGGDGDAMSDFGQVLRQIRDLIAVAVDRLPAQKTPQRNWRSCSAASAIHCVTLANRDDTERDQGRPQPCDRVSLPQQ
jgi:hypothetical protein